MDFNILIHKELYNKKSKEQLKERLDAEYFDRTTCSFYRYVGIEDIEALRDKLYMDWNAFRIV